MAKAVHNDVLDSGLNTVKTNVNQQVACAGLPTTFAEAVDPDEWAASTAYALGDVVRPSTRDGRSYECTTAGTSGGSEPSWDTTIGNTTADNTVTWTCRDNKMLASVAMVTGNFTLADGDTDGRKITVAEKTGGTVNKTGTGDHTALVDKTNKKLLVTTTATSQALTSGNPITFAEFKETLRDPT